MKVGEKIESYSLLRIIGKGGMGVVWAAEKDGCLFAIKICNSGNSDTKRRFEREFRLMKAINSPYVLKAYSQGTLSDGILYIVEELGDDTLDNLVEKGLSTKEKYNYVTQVCLGLADIHRYGETHRDIKPQNVLIVNGIAKITDFGIGKFIDRDTTTLTDTAETMGTHGYAAPELCEKGKFKEGSKLIDIFALGSLMYYVFSDGSRPDFFNYKQVSSNIYPILNKCREIKPEDRYQTVEEITEALNAVNVSRSKYLSLQQVFENQDKLSSVELTENAICILFSSKGISNLLTNLQVIASLWKKIDKSKTNFAEEITTFILQVFDADKDYWLQFEDTEIMARMTVLLSPLIQDPTLKVKILDFGLSHAVDANRWDALKDLHNNLFCKWDAQSIQPYTTYIIEKKELFFSYKEIIGVHLPSIISQVIAN